MTYPRSHLVDTSAPGFYHIISRCVRRSWLCGIDTETGQSYEHRRLWIEQRLESLAEQFSVEIYAYAVMSNHYHLVIYLDPNESLSWTEEEVARRWVDIKPPRVNGEVDEHKRQLQIEEIRASDKRLTLYRRRLSSLSWYMRFLNHPIACQANLEDGCKGHFWESRFKSCALLDEPAVIACMAYVDLNPVRAKIVERFSECDYTSIKRRLKSRTYKLLPFAKNIGGASSRVNLTQDAYFAYLRNTGLLSLERAPPNPQLRARVISMASYQRAFGSATSLDNWVSNLGQKWTHGVALP